MYILGGPQVVSARNTCYSKFSLQTVCELRTLNTTYLLLYRRASDAESMLRGSEESTQRASWQTAPSAYSGMRSGDVFVVKERDARQI